MRFKLLLLLLFNTLCHAAFAEQKSVTGVVADEDGQPIFSATVMIKDGTTGAITDANGNYSIKVDSPEDILVFNYLGMLPSEVKVSNRTNIDVTLVEQVETLDDVIVIGYGTVRRKEATGATVQVDGEELERSNTTDLGEALQGMVPGVTVTASSGGPGEAAVVQIRGVSTLMEDTTPLYVVDGIPQDGDPMISPSEIAQIDILKDAASCAIYGAQGASGVILITTKQGESGRLKVSAKASYAVQEMNVDKIPDLMNTIDYAYFTVACMSANGNGELDAIMGINRDQSYYLNNYSLYDDIINNFAPVQNYSATISGGKDGLTFSVMGEYYDKESIILDSEYERYSARANVAYKGKKLSINASANFLFSNQNKAKGAAMTSAMKLVPYSTPLDINDDVYVVANSNLTSDVVTLIKVMRKKELVETNSSSFNLGMDYKILPDLVANVKFGYKNTNAFSTEVMPNYTIYNADGELEQDGSSNSYVEYDYQKKLSLNINAGLTYNKVINNDHKLTALALYSYSNNTRVSFWAQKTGLLTDNAASLDVATGDESIGTGNSYNNKDIGFVSRLMYSYKSRYTLSVSARADASSKFSADNRWGYFPSISAGWNISDESFWEPLSKAVNSMKIRVSYGTTGNSSVAAYSYLPSLSSGSDYVDGDGNLLAGLTQKKVYNSDLKWETSKQINLGTDISFLKNKLIFSADIYDTSKKDMIAKITQPVSAGFGTGDSSEVAKNIGNMTNRGVELNLMHRFSKRNFSMSTSINYAINRNKITSLGDGVDIIYSEQSTIINGNSNSVTTAYKAGYEAGAFFLYQALGVANTEEKLAAFQKYYPSAQMGDMIYADTNGDGSLSDDDRVYCGSGQADFEMGLNMNMKFKNIDLTCNWYASVGNEIINGTAAAAYSCGRAQELVNMWSPENPDSEIPAWRGDTSDHMNYIGHSDKWVEDGSFLRLRLLSIGYTINNKIWKLLPKSTSLRVYFSAKNLITLTGYTGLDPEVGGNGLTTKGVDTGNYPVSRQYLFGIDFKL